MWQVVGLAGVFVLGYKVSGRAFGRYGEGVGGRVWAGILLGMLALVAAVVALLGVWVGGVERSPGAYLLAGVVVSGIAAAFGERLGVVRAGVLEWAAQNKGFAGVGVALVLAVVGVSVAWVKSGDAGAGVVASVDVPGPVVVSENKAAESLATVGDAAACLCAASAVCIGPRGGKYCVTDEGGKRYLARSDK